MKKHCYYSRSTGTTPIGNFDFAIFEASQKRSFEHPAASNNTAAFATETAHPATGPLPIRPHNERF